MAQPTQYTFALREVTKALIKAQGISEGKWMLAFNFNFVAGNVGPSDKEVRPAGIVQINEIMLSRQPEDAPEWSFIVDAAKTSATDED